MIVRFGAELRLQGEGVAGYDHLTGFEPVDDLDPSSAPSAKRDRNRLDAALHRDEHHVAAFDLLDSFLRQDDAALLAPAWDNANPNALTLGQPTWGTAELKHDGGGAAFSIKGRGHGPDPRFDHPAGGQLYLGPVAGLNALGIAHRNGGVDLESAGEGLARRLGARVAHVRPEALGHWFHGCVFPDQLTDDDLRDLLRAAR